MKRECHRLVSRPLYLFCMVIAPLFCYIFFTTLMDSGLPTNMPVGAVDLTILPAHETFSAIWTHSGKQLSWRVIAVLTKHVQLCRKAKSTDFLYTQRNVGRCPESTPTQIIFYTNNSYLIAGSLLFKDMKMMSELASGAAARSVLYAKGATEDQAMGYLQPIVIDTHPIQNPWLNYSVYLCNTLVPGY